MADQFLAEIRIVPFGFAPKGWAFCDGQLMPISQNTALFSLLGTNYGGDGKSTFALPDLQGAAPMHKGQGPGRSERFIGETGGSTSVTLLVAEMPAHNHALSMSARPSDNLDPTGLSLGTGNNVYVTTAGSATLGPQALAAVGGDQPHNNMQPFLTCNFCIALQGVFPQRQ
ncbi:MAG: tail fiber protein [Aurantimonas endophytica]|uniref:Microcystin-dependent protein n=1 Tax=Aurantimonas endophytica TaxID=1522175 RepID=A0A7W6HCC2_9HYPH|nr:tail fiber protein [Aurantimonas endophytica]MBB4002546.1 microcystin-dependent protein [Aurantimonas endophytica]MCO6403427.1 phage tail protein [Aurantimonas endophytica]